ncbi:MAG: hypothetical protein AAF725_13775 [Acidobacteriota bacterium]
MARERTEYVSAVCKRCSGGRRRFGFRRALSLAWLAVGPLTVLIPEAAPAEEFCDLSVAAHFSSGSFESVAGLSANLAFAGQSGRLVSLDPAGGVVLDRLLIGFNIRDIEVRGDVAYLATGLGPPAITGSFGALHLVDVSDPNNLRPLSSISTQGQVERLDVVGDRVYVSGLTDERDPPSVVQMIDVSDRSEPVELASFASETREIAVVGETAYVLTLTDGLRVYDVSDPAQIREIGFHISDASVSGRGLWVEGNRAFYANNTGVVALDVSNPAQPVEIGFEPLSSVTSLVARGERLYVGRSLSYLVLDTGQLPSMPAVDVGPRTDGPTRDLDLGGDHLFRSGETLVVYDVADPGSLPELAAIGRARGNSMYVKGDTLYLAGDRRLLVFQLERDGGLRAIAALPGFFGASIASRAPQATVVSGGTESGEGDAVLRILERIP